MAERWDSDFSFDACDPEPERYELREPLRIILAPDRRRFVQAAGTGLMLAAAAASPKAAMAQRGRSARRDEVLAERFFLANDGTLTVFTSKVEVGQGSRTQLTQAAAEELGLPIERIQLVMADTQRCPDDGGTAGSRTTPSTVPRVRFAAAALRNTLSDWVAGKLAVSPDQLQFQDGVFHAKDGRQIALSELAVDPGLRDRLERQSPGENTNVKPVEQWQVLGTAVEKVAGREVVTGAAVYPSDVRCPNMLYGKVLRPSAYGAQLRAVDLAQAQSMPDVQVVREGDFIGCVAPTSYQATRALKAIADTAQWLRAPHPDSENLFDHLKQTAESQQADDEPRQVDGKHRLQASFTISYVQHAPMEPRAALAEWNDDGLIVWTGTQQPDRVRSELSRAFRLEENLVRVIVPDTGGGFGGKHTGEVAVEAARLAKAVGRPVSLRWSREEEFTWAYFRPAGVIDVKAALDEEKRLAAWDFTNYNSGGSAIETPYRVSQAATRFVACDAPLRQGSYRALASTANTFAREAAMDELASMAGVDPLEFRLSHLDEGRLKDVLRAAAKAFGWGEAGSPKASNRGVGLACGTEKGSYVAACVEVELASSEIRIVRVCQAYECGAIQNPLNLTAQVEGAIIQGIGAALHEAITFRHGEIETNNFSSYFVPRMSDVPPIELVLLDRQDLPSVGAGETPIIAIAPAIANAVADATGKRLRGLPMKWS